MNDAIRKLYHIDITIKLKTPWLVQGSEPGRYGLDATLMRDHEGRLVLPGSLLVGRIRAAWNDLKDIEGINVPDAQEWFGDKGFEDNLHARIWTDDLVMHVQKTKSANLQQATRITVNEETEAAQNAHLQLIEQTEAAGNTVIFKGRWKVYLAENESKTLERHLRAGLLWHSQFGAQRSVGFGELLDVQMNMECADPINCSVSNAILQQQHISISLKMDRPICVATQNRRGNVFESSDIITGGTLKGAVAQLIRARHQQTIKERREICKTSKLAEHFDKIRFSHALPGIKNTRPFAIPLSLASAGKSILDLAKIKGPHLIDGTAPTFLHDWKTEWSAVEANRNWGKTTTHLRVRTAMDEKNRTAKTGDLFAYQCKVPISDTTWLATVTLSDKIPKADYTTIWNELTDLLQHGIGPIGKTDAWANVTFSKKLETVWSQKEIKDSDNTIILMLNTPALLLASSQVTVTDPKEQEINLEGLYREIFTEISKESLTLSHFYASHSMAGGEFLWRRYMNNRPDSQNKHYLPFVLTDAGSVFVLQINDTKNKEAKDKVSKWQKTGLSLPDQVKNEHGESWDQNPFIPENGFGEIAVNLAHGYHAPICTAC